MIGKVQDIVAGAVVIGAMNDSTNSGDAVNASDANDALSNTLEAQQPTTTEKVRAEAGTDEESQAQDQQKEKDEENLNPNQVSLMTKELNELMSRLNCNLRFQYHKEVDTMSVQMIDKKTNEVLKEVPPEDMIQHMIKAKDWLGAFLDQNA